MENPNVSEEILSLITAQTETINEEIEYYTLLLEMLIDAEDKCILRSVILNKKKHIHILNELYYRLKGTRPESSSPKPGEPPCPNLPEEFKKAALAELKNSETYRSLIFDFLNQSIRDNFTEIMTDSQNNSAKFSLLLTKYS